MEKKLISRALPRFYYDDPAVVCERLEAKRIAIVAKVEKALTLCDQLEIQINQNQSHAEQLMQAVLKEAFSNNIASTVATSQSEAISA